jgi:hypothetical protein
LPDCWLLSFTPPIILLCVALYKIILFMNEICLGVWIDFSTFCYASKRAS